MENYRDINKWSNSISEKSVTHVFDHHIEDIDNFAQTATRSNETQRDMIERTRLRTEIMRL